MSGAGEPVEVGGFPSLPRGALHTNGILHKKSGGCTKMRY